MGVQGKRVPSGGDPEIAAAQLDAARGTAQAFYRVVEFIPDIDFLLGRLRISVTQAPEKGKANKSVLKLLASALGVRRSELSLQSGETSPRKVIRVAEMSEGDLRDRLSTLAED